MAEVENETSLVEIKASEQRSSGAAATAAVLQAIRDRLPLAELARFGSALTPELRAMFYEGWNPEEREFPAVFEDDVRARLEQAAVAEAPAEAIRATWKLIGAAIHENNLAQILPLFPAAAELPLSA